MENINEETVAADLGPAPETAVFKGPQKRKQKRKGLRTFKQIAIDQQTDTMIKEKGKCKKKKKEKKLDS